VASKLQTLDKFLQVYKVYGVVNSNNSSLSSNQVDLCKVRVSQWEEDSSAKHHNNPQVVLEVSKFLVVCLDKTRDWDLTRLVNNKIQEACLESQAVSSKHLESLDCSASSNNLSKSVVVPQDCSVNNNNLSNN